MRFTSRYISISGISSVDLRVLYRVVFAFFVFMCPKLSHALYMYDGADYYLDNTLTQFQTPELVIYNGKDRVQVIPMEKAQEKGENYYKATVDLHKGESIHLDWCGYLSFVDATLREGFYSNPLKTFEGFLERYNIQRYTDPDPSTPPMLTDNVFKPYTSDNGTLGRWVPMDLSQFEPSQHLPVVNITTQDGQPIISKENYIDAELYIEPYGNEDVNLELGSAQEKVSVQIRGRGNSTWRSYKKPFKLKFSSKVDLMGTGKSKHYALIAPYDGGTDYLKTQLGTAMSNLLGFSWTPSYKPVELIINDEYLGIYFLIETVRVEKNRVNVTDQEDHYDPEDPTGGWLIEMDNYVEPNQIILYDGDGRRLKYTFHSPEEPNDIQLEWITNELKDMLQTMWTHDKSDNALWDKYLDLDDAVRYYLLGELLEDTDRYNGSIYLHREKGESEKWHYGPIWDLNSLCYYKGGTESISEKYPFKPQLLWELLKYPQFIQRAREMWEEFRAEKLDQLYSNLREAYFQIKDAVPSSQARYPGWATQEDKIYTGYLKLVIMLNNRSPWLSEWLEGLSAGIEEIYDDDYINPNDPNNPNGPNFDPNNPNFDPSTIIVGNQRLKGPFKVYQITGKYQGQYDTLTNLTPGFYIIRDAKGRTFKRHVR